MTDNYLLYDPAAFGAVEIKEDTRDAEITRLREENARLAALSAKASLEASQLREALKPFAEKEYAYEGWADIARAEVWLNVRDIRAAAAAIRKGGEDRYARG